MKRSRVYHLANQAGITPQQALSRLKVAGFKVNSINDQVPAHSMQSALNLLRQTSQLLEVSATITPDNPEVDRIFRMLFSSPSRSGEAKPFKPYTSVESPGIPFRIPRKHREKLQDVSYISVDSLKGMHEALVEMFIEENDPISPSGIKDVGLLESATFRPKTSLGETEKYKTVHAKAAALFHSLIKNHPFHNGNKRTALVALLVFLDLNGLAINVTDDNIFDFVIFTATTDKSAGRNADKEVGEIEEWLRSYCSRANNQTREMKTKDFLEALTLAGGRFKRSGDGNNWIMWGPNGKNIKIGVDTTTLGRSVVREYLGKFGLSHGQSGISFDEFQDGLDVNRRLIRKFRTVLKRLAHA